MRTLFLVLSVCGLSSLKSYALDHQHRSTEHIEHHDHKDDEKKKESTNPSVGPNKAILAADSKEGLRLSDRAKEVLGLRFLTLQSSGIHKIPHKSIVYHQLDVGVYRVREGWIKLIDVQAQSSSSEGLITVKSSELKSGDQIVTDGVPLLRVAELDAWSEAESDH